jgi:hypothetical protein
MSENSAPARFIRLGIRAGYLEAKRELEKRGLDFPSHPLVDKFMMDAPKKHTGPESETMVRAKELFAHPGRKGVFGRGDIVDARAGWLIPRSEVPPEAFGERFVGVYIVPKELEAAWGMVVVHPELVVVRHGVKPNILGGYFGVVDDFTIIPNALADREGVGKEMMRSLVTLNRGGIFVIERSEFTSLGDYTQNHNVVRAEHGPDIELEVVGVAKE